MDVAVIYQKLLGHFGPQGWWPVKHSFRPKQFEICVGAVLTQNTNWGNVEKALTLLQKSGLTSPENISGTDTGKLEEAVRPSGFYRQKAERLKLFSEFMMSFGGFDNFAEKVTRGQLLELKGLGPETADSVLLYALGRPVFVIDAYTRRVFTRLGFAGKRSYEEWRGFFEYNVPKDADVYREFHALVVELAKTCCRKKPLCSECPLSDGCARKV
jgi:endonuclease-3 related protein